MENGFASILLAGSSMLFFYLSVRRFVLGLKALNHFWIKDTEAKQMPYLKFLNVFFLSSLFDDNNDEHRRVVLVKLKSALNLFLLTLLIVIFSRNGGFALVEGILKNAFNAT